jgi:hypothetical protein
MTDIDAALARLRDLPVHPGLGTLDAMVLEGLASRASAARPLSASVVGMAALMALSIGIAGSAIPGTPVQAATATPFGAPPALAPSTLLGTSQ